MKEEKGVCFTVYNPSLKIAGLCILKGQQKPGVWETNVLHICRCETKK